MDKVLGMLGMAKRAGKVTSGAFLCGRAVREGLAQLVIIAKDISEMGKRISLASVPIIRYNISNMPISWRWETASALQSGRSCP